jgi:Proprotein convertase P-domain
VLDDEASSTKLIQNVTSAQAPYTGSFRPASPLSAFDGQNPNGTWTVNVSDRGLADTGNMRSFSLIITGSSSCSTTSLATPVEIRSDRALASLPPAGGDAIATTSRTGFNPSLLAVNNTGQLADLASLLTAQQDGLAYEPYLAELFDVYPKRIENELARTDFVLKRYNYLTGRWWVNDSSRDGGP